jgi:hypothetical protein
MKKLFMVLVMLLIAVPAFATSFEQISVTSGAVKTFTTAKITFSGAVNPLRAYCTLETGDVRYTIDGTTPTSTVGHLLSAGGWIEVFGPTDVVNFKAIATSTTGVLSCTYYAP